jgi:hypothetical protein
MADPASPSGATPEAGATPAGVAEAVPPPEGDELGESGKSAIAALRKELRTLKGERDDLASRVREHDDASKSELEKAVAARDEATGRVGDLELRMLKMQAAIDAGIPTHWKRLDGSNADELAADAKEFAKSIPQQTGDEQQTGATPATLGAGARPGTPATGRDGFNAAIRARVRR